MFELSATAYAWILAGHVISVIAWMAGMLYLPRLYVYHAEAEVGSELSETLKIMERRLLRAIINPAMIMAFIFGGIMLLSLGGDIWQDGWVHLKTTAVLGLTVIHGLLARWRRAFAEDRNMRSQRFFRFANEVPTVLMVVIVIAVIVKPF